MDNLKYQNGKLEILDQRLLPNEAKWLPIGSKEAAFEAIQTLAVRGAPAIGIFAAFPWHCLARTTRRRAKPT